MLDRTPLGPLLYASWVDWIDITALAFVIYRVLVVMHGTRAVQSLLGLAMIGALYKVSDLIGLTTVHWVLDKIFVYVVIAILILFQDDIRRALARAGGSLFGGRKTSRPSDVGVVEEVVKASFVLAHRKIGALVVIERSFSLAPYVEGAHPIDAIVSTELLQSIFHPSSPLHDGAVVIEGDRIVAAKCILPVTQSDVPKSYGTRHRAAIGMSEISDAIILVVSEETGGISIAHGGTIHRDIAPDQLANLLQRHFGANRQKGRHATMGS